MSAVAPRSTKRPSPPPQGEGERYQRILLATEGRVFPPAAIDRVLELAAPGAEVRVLSIARVHGTAFGMPSPGLLPTKKEWAAQRDLIGKAIKRLKPQGHDRRGPRGRHPQRHQEDPGGGQDPRCEAIVMAADPDRNRLVATAMWSQEPQRVRRKAKLPVYLVPVDD